MVGRPSGVSIHVPSGSRYANPALALIPVPPVCVNLHPHLPDTLRLLRCTSSTSHCHHCHLSNQNGKRARARARARAPFSCRHATVASALQDAERDHAFCGEALRFELIVAAPTLLRTAASAHRRRSAAARSGQEPAAGGGPAADDATFQEVSAELLQFKARYSRMAGQNLRISDLSVR